jgi:hypothetical protein
MSTTMKTWNNFKTSILAKKSTLIFKEGLTNIEIKANQDFINTHHFPIELLEILSDSNGQDLNSDPIFLELDSRYSGLNFNYYKFLSLVNIKEMFLFIQSFSKGRIDTNLIPFANIEKIIGDKGSIVFTIHTIEKIIYRTQFYEWDRFGTMSEFRSEKFAKNMDEFLENQILWHSLK